jgi:hypothetical protein
MVMGFVYVVRKVETLGRALARFSPNSARAATGTGAMERVARNRGRFGPRTPPGGRADGDGGEGGAEGGFPGGGCRGVGGGGDEDGPGGVAGGEDELAELIAGVALGEGEEFGLGLGELLGLDECHALSGEADGVAEAGGGAGDGRGEFGDHDGRGCSRGFKAGEAGGRLHAGRGRERDGRTRNGQGGGEGDGEEKQNGAHASSMVSSCNAPRG